MADVTWIETSPDHWQAEAYDCVLVVRAGRYEREWDWEVTDWRGRGVCDGCVSWTDRDNGRSTALACAQARAERAAREWYERSVPPSVRQAVEQLRELDPHHRAAYAMLDLGDKQLRRAWGKLDELFRARPERKRTGG
jgi:hypothetical protein